MNTLHTSNAHITEITKHSLGTKLLNDLRRIYKTIGARINSESLFLGLKRDLHREIVGPKAKINITVRPLKEGDLVFLLNSDGLTPEEAKQVKYQKYLVNSKLKTCYVAVDSENIPCYMQWLVSSKDNKDIRRTFKGGIPEVNANEALLEGAFMHHSFRGLGVMPDAMFQIAEKAKEIGVSEVVTFVGINNFISLKGCKRCGFDPYVLLIVRWFLFKKTVSLIPIPEHLLEKHNLAATVTS